ncbi:MAG: alkaline phosphatase D family protein [Dehalococcoidia bacterium]|nr:alkaline phosphatase D family protein [Dehalococcoidia bacterium]
MARPTFDAARFPFPHGEMGEWMALGGLSHRRIRAWLRSPHAEPRSIRVFDGDRQVAESSVTPAAAADWSASVELDLPFGVENRDLRVQSGELERTFRAAPVEGEPRSFAFWLGSCHQPYDVTRSGEVRDSRRSGIYDAIRTKIDQHNASFGILLGDQMYADEVPGLDIREWANDESPRTPAAALDVYRHLYRGFLNHRGMRQLQEARPTFLIWDDHEIFNSWGSYLSVGDSDQMLFEAASQAYREYQHARNPGTAMDDPAP